MNLREFEEGTDSINTSQKTEQDEISNQQVTGDIPEKDFGGLRARARPLWDDERVGGEEVQAEHITLLSLLAGRRKKKGKKSSEGRARGNVNIGDLNMFLFDLRAKARRREDAVEGTEREKLMDEFSRGGNRGQDKSTNGRNST